MENYVIWTEWFRVGWNNVFALGFGFDFESIILGIYFGPVSIFIGYNGYTGD